MVTFAHFNTKKQSKKTNNIPLTNIIGNATQRASLPKEKDAISQIIVRIKDSYIDSLASVVPDKKCDEAFIAPSDNIEYLSNHIDSERSNFRQRKVITNFINQNIEENYGIKFKTNYENILNNFSYLVIEDIACDWKNIYSDDPLFPLDPISASLNITETPTVSETPTPTVSETPTPDPTEFYKITKKQIKVFKVACDDENFRLTDITFDVIEPISGSDWDEDIYQEICEIYSTEFSCDTVNSDIELPNFFDAPVLVAQNDYVPETIDIEKTKLDVLTDIAEKYATKYNGVVKHIFKNLNSFCLSYKVVDKSYIRNVHRELLKDPIVAESNSDRFASFFFGLASLRLGNYGELKEKVKLDTLTANVSNENPVTAYMWHLDRINQRSPILDGTKSSSYPDGRNAIVYVFDTGVDISHPEFEGRAYHGYTAPGFLPNDGHGHGTHVAGTIAGKNVGIAKQARIISVKILSDQGTGSFFSIIASIEWAIEDIKKRKADDPTKYFLANFSLGGPAFDLMSEAIDELSKHCEVFAAAGNQQLYTAGSPARADGAYAIGATDHYNNVDKFAYYTNFGEKAVIYAPGSNIFSCLPNNRYARWSGTSMACPLALGAFIVDPDIFNNTTSDSIYCYPDFDKTNLSLSQRIVRSFYEAALCRRMSTSYLTFDNPSPDGSDDLPEGLVWNKLLYTNNTVEKPRPDLVSLQLYPDWPPKERSGNGETANYFKYFDWQERNCIALKINDEDQFVCSTFNPLLYKENRKYILFSAPRCRGIWDGRNYRTSDINAPCDTDNVSTVGTNGKSSWYGTYDQNGNAWEYVERKSDANITIIFPNLSSRLQLPTHQLSVDKNYTLYFARWFAGKNGARKEFLDSDNMPLNYIDLVYNQGLLPFWIGRRRNVRGMSLALTGINNNYLHMWNFDENTGAVINKQQGLEPNLSPRSKFQRDLAEIKETYIFKYPDSIKPLNLNEPEIEYWFNGNPQVSLVGGSSSTLYSTGATRNNFNEFSLPGANYVPYTSTGTSIRTVDIDERSQRFYDIEDVGIRIVSKENKHNYPNFVKVGDINNLPHEGSGFGRVGYEYYIGKYLVTNAEYCEFLNAIGGHNVFNSYAYRGYFNLRMMYGENKTIYYGVSGSRQTPLKKGGIIYVKSEGRFYPNSQYENKPVVFVPFYAAARYCNWLHNGKPNRYAGRYTETGAYTIESLDDYILNLNSMYKDPDGLYHLPTIDEWYKAAFYKGNQE